MSQLDGERILTPMAQPTVVVEVSKRKQQLQQPRQLLSCTKCRERKVKCDRTKPCSACCARGAPKECHFIAEGGDYVPIQQSYELRKLRAENLRLKDRLRTCRIPIEDEDSDYAASPESQLGDKSASSQKRRPAKQRRFQGNEWQDSIYFGSPALSSVMSDFASPNVDAAVTLAHLMPRSLDMHSPRTPRTYPFATLFKANPDECIPQLLSCLPLDEGELEGYLNYFDDRVNLCSFPQVAVEINRAEIDRYLSDARRNAQICPDMLALVFAAIALGAQHSVWDKSGQQWDPAIMRKETGKGDVYIAAAMQALRLASFMHKPTLLGIQALIMIGPYLTNSGRFLDSWTLFGTTIRLAHAIGLHRHPKYLNPVPPTQKECSTRQRLWWWMLHMDEQYSMTLGRPLGISGIGDCSWPQELTTDPILLRFGEFKNRFTVIARRILSSDKLTNARIDEFTDELRALLDTMPETLQYQESWNQPESDAPEWPLRAAAAMYHCKTHTYLILLNRQRIEKASAFTPVPIVRDPTLSFRAINTTPTSQPSPSTSTQIASRGRSVVLSSSEDVISTFMFFYFKEPAALIDWTLGQQAFNGCMLLLYDAIETRSITIGARKVEQVFAVFKELQDNRVHELAGQAVDRISWGLTELHKVVTCSSTPSHQQELEKTAQGEKQNEATYHSDPIDTVMGNTGMMLLEDTGLQAFVREAYTPITWIPSKTTDLFAQERGHQLPGSVVAMNEDSQVVQSTDAMQSTRRSTGVGSVRGSYTNLSLEKPQSYTTPAAAAEFAMPHQYAYKEHCTGLQQQQPQDQRQITPTQPMHTQVHSNERTSATRQLLQHTQNRHNSCPSLPPQTAHHPPIRPTYSSPNSMDTDIPILTQHSYHKTPRAPLPALVAGAPMTTSMVTSLATPMATPMPMHAPDSAAYDPSLKPTPHYLGYPFAPHVPTAATTSLTPLTEDLSMEDWRPYVVGEGRVGDMG